ncbi:centromere protein H-like isoform X2 [Hyperolius riggenbachi]|uniref:centromere protein H-like isoform X2 n=1 Tax=Hyperolius riggenbachi TaxID=752182 RepID=UPI0035A3A72D
MSSKKKSISLKKQMQQQLTEMRTHLQTRGTSNEHVDSSFNVSLSAVCDPLEDEICSAKNKELLLKRLQTCKALMNSLKRDPNQCLSVAAVMRHTMDNNKQIWALARSNRELEKQVIDIRKRRIDIQIRQQELFRKLTNSGKTKYKIRETQMKTQMKEREILETLSNEVVILQEVFQRCVMGAQVNWAEDPLLTSLLLRMRDPRFC